MVSFIIPTHNSREYIEKCIDSICNSNIFAGSESTSSKKNTPVGQQASLEIIVIDDASTDGISDFIHKNYPVVKFFYTPKRRGAAYARNLGIIKSSGNILVFIDSDVWLNSNCIDELIAQINNYDIVYTIPFFPNGIPIFPIFAARDYPVISAFFMIKRKTLEKLDKYFDENYEIYNEDLDFFLRCKICGLTAKYVKSAKSYHWLKESKNAEFRYYMDLRNSIYAYLKFYKLNESIVSFPSIKIILQNMNDFLWNKNAYSKIYFENKKGENLFLKLWYKFSPVAKITNKTRFYIIYMILKAFMWNLKKFPEIKQKNRDLRIFLSKLPFKTNN